MVVKTLARLDKELLNQLAALTGLVWTLSLLAYMSMLAGYGTELLSSIVTAPRTLLALSLVAFLVTVGLDRLRESGPEDASPP